MTPGTPSAARPPADAPSGMAYAAGSMRQVLLRASAKVAVSALGGALVAIGIGMLFLPGPGILVLVAGLAVLAREFLWARRLRDRLNARVDALRQRARRHREDHADDHARDDVPAV